MITWRQAQTYLRRGEGQQSLVAETAHNLHKSVQVGKGVGRRAGGEPRNQCSQQESEVMGRTGGSSNPLPHPLLHFGGKKICPEKAVITLLSQ